METEPDIEEEALAVLRRGDRARALTLLMSAYGRPVFRYCRAMLRDAATAEDVHQTVFFQAYQDLHHFCGRSSLRAWLFGIAHHRCLDALKSRRRRTARFSALEDGPGPPDPARPPEARISLQEASGALRRCLERLSAAVREVLLLRYQAEMSYVEMEAACGERAATLQARVARALPGLRRCLGDHGVGP